MATALQSVHRAPVTWRPMVAADVVYVAALEAQIHAVPWTPGNFRDALAAGYSAQVGEREEAHRRLWRADARPREAQLLNLSVVHDARRAGLGATLLARFVEEAERLGAEQVFLEVRVSNAAAIALYEREGFARVARRAGYYPAGATEARPEDALVMRRHAGGRFIMGP